MARGKIKAESLDLKGVLGQQEDFMRALVQETVQLVLDGEMDEALQAGKESARRVGRVTAAGTTPGVW